MKFLTLLVSAIIATVVVQAEPICFSKACEVARDACVDWETDSAGNCWEGCWRAGSDALRRCQNLCVTEGVRRSDKKCREPYCDFAFILKWGVKELALC